MKVNVEVDATPEEFRRFFGLPDVQPLNEEMINAIRERMRAGSEGYDPVTLMTSLMPAHLQNMEGFQKAFWEAFSGSASKEKSGTSDKDR